MDCPIRAESGKGRSAHIFNLNERAVIYESLVAAFSKKQQHNINM